MKIKKTPNGVKLDGVRIFPCPCPSDSSIEFRVFWRGENGKIARTEINGETFWLSNKDMDYYNKMKKFDRIPPWEKCFIVSDMGISQRQVMTVDNTTGNILTEAR